MYLDVYFNDELTTIELCDTPAAKLWLKAYDTFKAKGYDYKAETIPISVHSNDHIAPDKVNPLNGFTQQKSIDLLNSGINDVNKVIEGVKFPYRAYVGMPWAQVNRIHRAFTTASSTRSTWFHTLTQDQLMELKKLSYSDKSNFMIANAPKDFKILDEDKFIDAAERINQGVHRYETFLHSRRARNAENIVGRTDYIELDWTTEDTNFIREFFYGNRISYEDLKASFPTDYSKYDVFIGKIIEGKDYEFAFCEYDDGLEFDITNLDWICGDLRVHHNKNGNKFYTDTLYKDWIDDIGLSDEFHLPVPLGRIINTESDFSDVRVDYNSEVKLNNGNSPLIFPFNKVKTELRP
jgi:hypothetical protein